MQKICELEVPLVLNTKRRQKSTVNQINRGTVLKATHRLKDRVERIMHIGSSRFVM